MINEIIDQEEWKDWATNKVTKEFLIFLKERKNNTLNDQNKSADWPEFKRFQGRILELQEIVSFIEEQKKGE